MEARAALVVAVVAGLAAVAVVAVDTVYGVQARLETMKDGQWELIGETQDAYAPSEPMGRPYGPGCATTSMKLTVENKKPVPDTVTVEASWADYSSGQRDGRIFRETWDLGAFETRAHEFTVPPEARPSIPPEADPAYKPTGTVNVFVEGIDSAYFYPCVTFEEASS